MRLRFSGSMQPWVSTHLRGGGGVRVACNLGCTHTCAVVMNGGVARWVQKLTPLALPLEGYVWSHTFPLPVSLSYDV